MPLSRAQQQAFLARLRALKGSTLITVHSRADLDAVCTALALQSKVPNSIVYCPDEPSKKAARVLHAMGASIPRFSSLDDFDNVIFCDASSAEMLGEQLSTHEFPGETLIIDHHAHSERVHATASLVDDSRSSCCEVVWWLFGGAFSARNALLLAVGALDDTAFFKSANTSSIVAFSEMLQKSGESFETVRSLASLRSPTTERIAVVKAMRSSKMMLIGSLLVGVVETGAFELDCAAALVEAGCDYGFALNGKDGKIFSVKFAGARGPPVGEMLSSASNAMNGSGGGHDLVGGSRGDPVLSRKALDECFAMLKKSERATQVRTY